MDYDKTVVQVAGDMLARAGYDPSAMSEERMREVVTAYVRFARVIITEANCTEPQWARPSSKGYSPCSTVYSGNWVCARPVGHSGNCGELSERDI